MKSKRETFVTVTRVACAIATNGLVVRHELFASRAAAPRQDQRPIYRKDWQTLLGAGIRSGSPAAPVQLLEFSAFDCPLCAVFHKDLELAQQRYPTQRVAGIP